MTSVLGLDLDHLGGAGLALAVAALVFTESGILVGLLLPGDTILFAAGLLTANRALGLDPVVLAAVSTLAAAAGGALAWTTGRRLGRPMLAKRVNPATMERAESLNGRYGAVALIAARWIPWIRTLLPHVAGAAGMPWRRFLLADVVGAVTWAATLVLLGRLSAEVPVLKTIAEAVAGTFVGASAVAGLVLLVRRRRSAA